MPEYTGEVTQTRRYPYTVVADTPEEAVALVRSAFDNGDPTQPINCYNAETIDVQVKQVDA